MDHAPRLPPNALDEAVAAAFRIALATMEGTVTAASVALEGLEPIELPPTSDASDTEWLSTAAALYLSAHLEAAGVIVAAETVAGLMVAGGIGATLAPEASDVVLKFWRGRRQRLVEQERQEFLVRIFGSLPGLDATSTGGRSDDDVEMAMVGLADAIVRMVSAGGGSAGRAAVCVTAQAVGEALSARAAHVPLVVAADLISATRESLAVLGQRSVMSAFQARTVWGTLQNVLRRYRGEQRPVAAHVSVGREGVVLLAWLHTAWPTASAGSCGSLPAVTDELAASAAAWLQGSLSLHENPTQHLAAAGSAA
jgi:hypothetical protein